MIFKEEFITLMKELKLLSTILFAPFSGTWLMEVGSIILISLLFVILSFQKFFQLKWLSCNKGLRKWILSFFGQLILRKLSYICELKILWSTKWINDCALTAALRYANYWNEHLDSAKFLKSVIFVLKKNVIFSIYSLTVWYHLPLLI